MSRLGPVEPDELSAEQRRVYDAISSGPRAYVGAMFSTLIHAPELADRIQNLGEYLRFKTALSPTLSALAALLTARHYTCEYVWQSHAPKAKKFGLAESTIEAIRTRIRPNAMTPDETTVYEFTMELLTHNKVSDSTYAAALRAFDKQGIIELGIVIGYYIMIEMTVLAHQVPASSGNPPQLEP